MAFLFFFVFLKRHSHTGEEISCIEKASVPFGSLIVTVIRVREHGATLFSSLSPVCGAVFRPRGKNSRYYRDITTCGNFKGVNAACEHGSGHFSILVQELTHLFQVKQPKRNNLIIVHVTSNIMSSSQTSPQMSHFQTLKR